MKRYLVLLSVWMIATSIFASTPFKNLYVTAEAYPSGAGEVYLTARESDKLYVKEETGQYGQTVALKYTCAENGSQDQYANAPGYVEDATGTLGMYEAVIKVRPQSGYEFVCLATEISATGVYNRSNSLQRHTGAISADYKFFWNYNMEEASLINVNVSDQVHPVDLTTDEGTQAYCFHHAPWHNEPDRKLYAIFRKVGDEKPYFEEIISGDCGTHVAYTFNTRTRELVISGTGEMTDYGLSSAPWHSFCTSIEKVTIHKGVTSIGSHAFYGCSALASISIPEGTMSIGASAFHGCSSLASISIPEGVTSIGASAFHGCSGLISIAIPHGVINIGLNAFHGCSHVKTLHWNSPLNPNHLTAHCRESLTEVVLGAQVTSIEGFAFSNCTSLVSITLHEGVTSIGVSAFAGCSGLASISIPESVTCIGECAFDGCSSLASIAISANVASIGLYAFHDCTHLRTLHWNSPLNPNHLTAHCRESLTEVVLGSQVTSIEERAFYGCSFLASITLHEGVTRIGQQAFAGCMSLTAIAIPKNVTSIEKGAFKDCFGLTSLTLPEGVTSMGESAFQGCYSLATVNIPKGVTSIERGVFYGCSALASIALHEGVTSIGFQAFYGCSNLADITIPKSVTSIHGEAFYGCSSLISLILHEGVTHIGERAFHDCSSLIEIYLYAKLVPTIFFNTFPNYNAPTLYVYGSVYMSYLMDAFWGKFAAIVGMTDPAVNVSVAASEGGSVTGGGTLAIGSSATVTAIPNEHWCFMGWYSGGTLVSSEASFTFKVESAIVLTAHFAKDWLYFTAEVKTTAGAEWKVLSAPEAILTIHDDFFAFRAAQDVDLEAIQYIRTFNDTQWQSLYLPFDSKVADLGEDFEVAYVNNFVQYDMDGNGVVDKSSVEIIPLTSGTLMAGYPYLIRAKESSSEPQTITFRDVTLKATDGLGQTADCRSVISEALFRGTFEAIPAAQAADASYYVLSDNQWSRTSEGVKAFRSFMTLTSRSAAFIVDPSQAIQIRMAGEEDDPTGLITPERIETQPSYYDLQGRKAEIPVKGQLYVVGGRKVIY